MIKRMLAILAMLCACVGCSVQAPDQPVIFPQLGHSSTVIALAFSLHGTLLASGGRDGEVILWDVVSWRELRTLSGQSGEVTSVAFSPNGHILAAGGDPGVKLWDVPSGSELPTFGHFTSVTSVAFSPDGQILAAGSNINRTISKFTITRHI